MTICYRLALTNNCCKLSISAAFKYPLQTGDAYRTRAGIIASKTLCDCACGNTCLFSCVNKCVRWLQMCKIRIILINKLSNAHICLQPNTKSCFHSTPCLTLRKVPGCTENPDDRQREYDRSHVLIRICTFTLYILFRICITYFTLEKSFTCVVERVFGYYRILNTGLHSS